MAFFFASEINRRSSNEDSYCQMEIHMNAEAVVKAMVVADGMGGLSGGKYYSEAAVNLWYQELLQTLMSDRFKGNPLDRQIEILQEFSEEIYSKLNQGLYKKGLDAGIKGGTSSKISWKVFTNIVFIVSLTSFIPIFSPYLIPYRFYRMITL